MIRNVPHLALIPLVIIWFGIGEAGKVFLVTLGVFFPIYANTYHGIKTTDPQLIEMGRVYGLTPSIVQPDHFPRRLAFHIGGAAVFAGLDVADADRRRNHCHHLRHRPDGHERQGIHADRRRGIGDSDLRLAGQTGRYLGAFSGTPHFAMASGI